MRYISFYFDFFGTNFTPQCSVNKDGGKFDVRLLRNENPNSVERASFASVLSQISWRAWRSRFRPLVLFVCLDIVAVAKTNCITGCATLSFRVTGRRQRARTSTRAEDNILGDKRPRVIIVRIEPCPWRTFYFSFFCCFPNTRGNVGEFETTGL